MLAPQEGVPVGHPPVVSRSHADGEVETLVQQVLKEVARQVYADLQANLFVGLNEPFQDPGQVA